VFHDEDDLAGFVIDDVGAVPGGTALNITTALHVARRPWTGRDGAFLVDRVRDMARSSSPNPATRGRPSGAAGPKVPADRRYGYDVGSLKRIRLVSL
jgi:hypothetical protein